MLYKTGIILLNVQDTMEESLGVIDDRIDSINKILDIPLFSDSPEIKTLRKDMMMCRDAMLDIAYSLSASIQKQEDPSLAQDAEQQ